jgi:Subtilase family/Carboxypeptidase regulatory-like domain
MNKKTSSISTAGKTVPQNRKMLRNLFLGGAFLIIGTVLAIGITSAPGSGKASAQSLAGQEISLEAQMQIKSLIDEKNARTPVQQKIDSNLLYATKMHRGESITSAVPTLEINVGEDANGVVTVDISADVSTKLLATLKRMGVDVESSFAEYHTLRARVRLDKLEDVAALPQIRFIMPKQESTTSGIDRGGMLPSTPSIFSSIGAVQPVANQRQARFQNVASRLADLGIGDGDSTTNLIPNGHAGTGSAHNEAVITHGIYGARGAFNTTGAGIKIGVLSNGVVSLATSQGLGDLGPVTVIPGQTGTGDEGTAMLEIIHDIAPAADLYFATANSTPAQFATNILALRAAGCDIIVDDVFYFAESPFQDGQAPTVISPTNGGIVAQAVKDVTASGALFFSSAGNSGNKNDNTSGTWEGDFVSAGTLALVPGGNVADFDPTVAVATSDLLTVGTGTAPMSLDWSDPLGGSSNDYDLFVLNSTLTTVITSAANVQTGTQDPHEQTTVTVAANRRAVILQKTGAADRFLHLSTNRGALSISTNGTTYGHSAGAAAYGTAAVPAFMPFAFPAAGPVFFNGPYPALHSATNKVETFSSDGPRRLFYNEDSTAITPGNVSSTGGVLRQKPDIAAADGGDVTGVGGFGSPFYGTSAAAPTAAAIAGLLKSANPALTPAQVRTALTTSAIDIEGAGVDPDTGAGMVMAIPAMNAAGLTGRAFIELDSYSTTDTSGTINGVVEQGEGGVLTVNLKNSGVLNATGITTTLTTSTPNIGITQGSSAYANLTANGGTGSNTTQYGFFVNNLVATDQIIDFTLTINYTNGWNPSQVINFKVRTNRIPITTTLDASAPPTSAAYPTTASGNQTGRLNLSGAGTQSTCAALKVNPGASATGSRAFDSYTFVNPLGVPVCTTVTLTEGSAQNDFLFAVAYLGSYNPAAPSTNYLADWGTSNRILPMTMSFNVPAGATVVIVVVGNTAALTGTPYTLDVSGLRLAAPTAAAVSVSGRVTTGAGIGIGSASVTLAGQSGPSRTVRTNPFGYYRFDDVSAGQTYMVSVSAKRYRFAPRTITVGDDLTEVDFTPNEN